MIGIPTSDTAPPTLRSMWNDSLRYWEPRRLVYNGLLVVVVCLQLTSLGGIARLMRPHAIPAMIVAVAAANLCYTAAYLIDMGLQYSDFRESWLERRGILFACGCILGVALTVLSLPEVLRGLTL